MNWQKIINVFLIVISIMLVFQLHNFLSTKQLYDKLNLVSAPSKNLTYEIVSLQVAIENPEYVLVDVREPEEYNVFYLNGSVNIRHGDLMRNSDILAQLQSDYYNKTLALYCFANQFKDGGDGRSANAASYLQGKNISVVVIDGGISDFSEQTDRLVYNDISLFEFSEAPIKTGKGDCYMKFTYNLTAIYTSNSYYLVEHPASYLTTKEKNYFIDTARNKSCYAICIDKGTCFYANIFGSGLIARGADYQGFVLE